MSAPTTTKSYHTDYEMLQLDDRADWNSVRMSYRRLVHLWHPDKFAQRPREKEYAQRQFINLTKSYNSLRSFQRSNGRLPFEPVRMPEHNRPRGKAAREHIRASGWRRGKRTDENTFSAGVLGRDKSFHDASGPDNRFSRLWIASGVLVIFGTIAFLLVQDTKATKATLEQGREVVKQAPQSEFLPDIEKIRKARSREAVLQPPR